MTDGTFERLRAGAAESGVFSRVSGAGAVVVGYSGGADSSLLLHFLHECETRFSQFPKTVAVHVNHMIRGDEANRDEAFCRDACARLGVPLCVRRADVPSLARERGLGIEECARDVRYSVFSEVREILALGGEYNGTALPAVSGEVLCATAHNADDNLETVLFDLVRGSGAAGLAGISPVRGDGTVRPLISFTSEDIRETCALEGIAYVVDSTNADGAYTRNYIRREIVPSLKKINPSAAAAALRSGVLLREDEEYFRKRALEALGEYAASDEVPRELLAPLPLPVLSRAIEIIVSNVTDVRAGARHVDEARSLVKRSGCGKVTLPGGVTLEVSKSLVTVRRGDGRTPVTPFPIRLPDYGETVRAECPEAGFDLILSRGNGNIPPENANIYKLSIHTAVGFDKIKGKLFVRARQPGDRVEYGGQTHKLKKLLTDKGIPESERDYLPVICDDGGILCVPGIAWRGARVPEGEVLDIFYLKHKKGWSQK